MLYQHLVRAIAGGCLLSGALFSQTAKVDFRKDVMPLFKAHCIDCHGPSLQMNGFRLDRRSVAMRGGTLPQIGPGNADASRMYLKLIGTTSGPQMPPSGPLQPEAIQIIKKWIDQGADWPDDVSGETPLPPPDPTATRIMESLRLDNPQQFRTLVAANPKAANLKGPGGSTPLMYAALYGGIADMRLLLDKGADVNARNHAGATALMWAADDLEKTRLLLDRGANVNAKSDDGRTALMIAAGWQGNSAVVKLLLDHGADITPTSPALFRQTNALAEAAYGGDEASVRLLIEHGAAPKSAGPAGLAFSMRAQCGACTQLFIKGAKPDILIPAAFFVSPPLGPGFGVAPLLQAGADPNAKDPNGNSLLSLVASSPAYPVDAVRMLLEKGADPNAPTRFGETPLELARRHGQTPIVDLLVKAGAKESNASPALAPKPKPAENLRAAVQRSLSLLQSNDATFLKKSGCVSCHNNSLTSMTLGAARKSGFAVDEKEAQQQLKTIGAYLETWRDRAIQNIGIPGDVDTVGYILMGLSSVNYPPDVATDAMARYIRKLQLPDGHWRPLATRPPLESSEITVAAVAMRGMQIYAPKPQRAEYAQAVRQAAAWIAKAQPQCTEDRAFQLLALAWSDAAKPAIRKAADALLAQQRPDGGWSQIPTLPSDAYASGEALVALQQSAAVTAADPACKRGLEFLRTTQAEDGSWYVRRRALPIQPFFESGFPYGKDQFISASATNWAATALALGTR